MTTQQHTSPGRRTASAFIILLAALALFATVAAASAPIGTTSGPATTPTVTPSPTPEGCIQTWHVVDTPNADQHGVMLGVDALSSTDAWAVGDGVIEHWDGGSWTEVLTGTTAIFFSISAISPDDIWAVGRDHGPSYDEGVTFHWNGTTWSRTPAPVGNEESRLWSVEAISTNDVWAVGYAFINGSRAPLTLHWDGSIWTNKPTPDPGASFYSLLGVSAVATNDVWAVGSAGYIIRWDGSQWNVSSQSLLDFVRGVVAVSADDIWAVGTDFQSGGNTSVIIHWNGTTWSLSSSRSDSDLEAVTATGPSDVWAVGFKPSGTFTRHWNGSSWTDVDSPRPQPFSGQLWGVAAISTTDVWAVGPAGTSSGEGPLIARYTQWCPPPVTCATGWNIIDGPDPSPDLNLLFGVDATSSTDIWAVGMFDSTGPHLTQHWNGSYWSIVPISGSAQETILRGVSAISTNDVWGVGWTYSNGAQRQDAGAALLRDSEDEPGATTTTVTAHWDGNTWSIIPSPAPSSIDNRLTGVDGIATDDVWAVGSYSVNNQPQTLILHWNGTAWTQLPGQPGSLSGVTALASNDVWTAGSTGQSTLIMHWDGTAWSTMPSPNPGTGQNSLAAISAIGPADIWAVGSSDSDPVTLHWDGIQWTSVPATGMDDLYSVSGTASNDVWAVGTDRLMLGKIIHWDGTSWTSVPHPSPDPQHLTELNGVVAISANEVWAVGHTGQYYLDATIERYIGSCSTPSPVPSATSTDTPTATAVSTVTTMPSTNTPTATTVGTSTPLATVTSATSTAIATATPTACTITFTDVPEGSTFYPFIRCLACRGIINGYPEDNTFRPNNPVSRGQLAKIVSNSAGFTDPAGAQIFEDVLSGSTFYDFVQRLASRGYMSGYPCGSPGEPCGSGNLPYFRSNANATRGQISKIVSNAAGFTEPAGAQAFEDVLPGSTFYDFIQRLASRNIMSGYPCGSPGEPCGTGNLPYFRPDANATRGQTAKIVGNTFFPNCQTPAQGNR
ncbi:MAG: S-layer homology domain-containing protein [Chloroflexota bacterium]